MWLAPWWGGGCAVMMELPHTLSDYQAGALPLAAAVLGGGRAAFPSPVRAYQSIGGSL